MTLLFGTVTTAGVVITADGLSIKNEKEGRRAIGRTTLQKIFTDEKRLAIGHYGDNVDSVEKRSIASILREFVRQVCPTAAIRDVALNLEQKIRIAEGGIWVGGFQSDTEYPLMYEVVWRKELASELIELPRRALHRRGNGAQFVDAEHGLDIDDLETIAARHDGVYDTACENQQRSSKPKCFGGHKHQLVIGRKPVWRTGPVECGLGFKEILDELGVPATAVQDLGSTAPPAAIRAEWCEFRQWCSQQLGCKKRRSYGGIEERFSQKGFWNPVKRYADTALAMFDEAGKCEGAEVAREDAELFAGHIQWLKQQITLLMQ